MKKIFNINNHQVYEENELLGILEEKENYLVKHKLSPRFCQYGPQEIQIELTHKCNLKCIFCYNDSGKAYEDELSDEEIIKIVMDAIELNVAKIIFSGGEIFCRKKILFKCIRICNTHGIIINLITNATFLTDEDIKFLVEMKQCINMVQISVDGASANIHEELRGIKGCWKNTITNAYKLVKEGIHVKFASVITSKNFSEIQDIAELAYLLNVEELHFGVVIKQGRAVDSESSLSEKEYEQMPEMVSALADYYDGKMLIYYSQPVDFIEKMKRLSVLKSVEIRGNGKVYKNCTSEICFGSIKEASLKKVWESANMKWNAIRGKKYFEKSEEFITKE